MRVMLSYAGFLSAMVLAGFLSGALDLGTLGLRGAIVAVVLGLGMAYVGQSAGRGGMRERLTKAVLIVGLLSGVLAATAVSALNGFRVDPPKGDFGLSEIPSVGLTYASCVSMTTCMLLAYRDRHRGMRAMSLWLLLAVVASAGLRAVGMGGWGETTALAFLLCALVGSTPFVALVLLAARCCDPAWTQERWNRISEPIR